MQRLTPDSGKYIGLVTLLLTVINALHSKKKLFRCFPYKNKCFINSHMHINRSQEYTV